jgi:hypothetical protein
MVLWTRRAIHGKLNQKQTWSFRKGRFTMAGTVAGLSLLISIAIALLSTPAQGGVIHVPGDYPTIQQAIKLNNRCSPINAQRGNSSSHLKVVVVREHASQFLI